jgi:hypothetical protein
MEAAYAFGVALADWRARPDHSLAGSLHSSPLIQEAAERFSNEAIFHKSRIPQLLSYGAAACLHHCDTRLHNLGRIGSGVQLLRHVAASHKHCDHSTHLPRGILDSKQPESRRRSDPGEARRSSHCRAQSPERTRWN